MRSALALARRGLGNTWPNPAVGCVVVKDGRVVGRAVTAPGGRPHAETVALQMAGAAARGATAYVTLEPCCHWGQTAPCTDALIGAGVARVVIGAKDPDPRVNGGGVAKLQGAGVAVEEGVLRTEVEEVSAGFFSRVCRGRPLVTLKLATTLDGRIGTGSGESRWITGEPARRVAHALRGRHDAVMVGVGTVLADDPDLTCRLPGYKQVPMVRVIVDTQLRTPPTAKVLATAHEAPTWFVVRRGADPERQRAFAERGARLIEISDVGPGGASESIRTCSSPPPGPERLGEGRDSGANPTSPRPSPPHWGGEGETMPSAMERRGLALAEALRQLGRLGLNQLLVEGGARIAGSLLRADLVDRIAWFHAPGIIGGDGWPATQAFGVASLESMPRFVRRRVVPLGEDVLTELVRAAGSEARGGKRTAA